MSTASQLAWVGRLIESSDRWECVHFVARDEMGTFEAYRTSGFHVASIPGAALSSDAKLFDALAASFEFPDYFGRNWDAVADCLGDLEWLDAKGFVLLIDDVSCCGLSQPLVGLLQIWPSVAQEWSGDGKPFHLVGLLD